MIVDRAMTYLSKIKSTFYNSKLIKYGTIAAVAGFAAYTLYENFSQLNSDQIDEGITSSKSSKTVVKDPLLQKSIDLKDKGNKFFKASNYEKALHFYQQALDICPESEAEKKAICYQNMAVCHENLKSYDKALDCCNSAIKLSPKYKKAFLRRSSIYKNLEDYSNAFLDATYYTFLENYENFEAMIRMDELMKKLSEKLAEEESQNLCRDLPIKMTILNYLGNFIVDPTFCNVDLFLTTPEKPFQLNEYIKTVFEPNGDDGSAPLSSGLVDFFKSLSISLAKFREKKFDESFKMIKETIGTVDLYDERIKECQGNNTALVLLSLAHLLLYTFCVIIADAEGGKKHFEQIVKINQEENVKEDKLMKLILSNAHIKKANAAVSYEQDMDGCLNAFKRAEELCPNSPDVFLHRAQIYFRSEDFDRALTEFDKVIHDLKTNHPIALSLKVFCEHRKSISQGVLSNKDVYIKKLENILKDNEECFETLSVFSNVLIDYGDFERAESVAIKIQEKYPDSPMGYFNLGILYLHWTKDKTKITKWMNKALEVDPKCDSAIEVLGQLAMEDGEFEKALEHFQSAVKFARNKNDLSRLIGYRESAIAQIHICREYQVEPKQIINCIQNMQKRLQASMF